MTHNLFPSFGMRWTLEAEGRLEQSQELSLASCNPADTTRPIVPAQDLCGGVHGRLSLQRFLDKRPTLAGLQAVQQCEGRLALGEEPVDLRSPFGHRLTRQRLQQLGLFVPEGRTC